MSNSLNHYTAVFHDYLVKEAECSELPNDEGMSTKNEADTEKPKAQASIQFSDAVRKSMLENRTQLLKKLFDMREPAAKADRAFVAQQFNRGATGDYESNSALLEKQGTLRERTKGLISR